MLPILFVVMLAVAALGLGLYEHRLRAKASRLRALEEWKGRESIWIVAGENCVIENVRLVGRKPSPPDSIESPSEP